MAGLTSSEAAARLRREGANELPRAHARSLPRIVLGVVREPMFAMLLAAGGIYAVLGDIHEALLLLAFATLSVGIAVTQESRSERVLEALRDLTSPRALVIRDGERRRVPGREVVRGDLVVLSEGDRVAADGTLVQCDDLLIDESLLTGESVPVRKRAARPTGSAQDQDAAAAPGGEDLPAVFAGTLVVRGQGVARVTATGARSQVGRIGQTLREIESATPRLTQQTRAIVRMVGLVGLVCCALAIVLFGLFRGSWLDAVLAGIALAMSMLPEEFPLVLTVFMVMGAWRLSQARVLTRRAAAIETLGAATVLCTDKTGTMTENRMSIAELRTPDATLRPDAAEPGPWPEAMQRLLRAGVLASTPEPFDPMDRAFHAMQAQLGTAPADLTLAKVWPIRSDSLVVAQAWIGSDRDGHIVAAKGAPEAVLGLCRLPPEMQAGVSRLVDDMAAAGLRVLGVAEARCPEGDLPESLDGLVFVFVGLVGLADPLRRTVPAAVAECHSAGIRVAMITGDYPQTARAIAAQAAIPADAVLTGAELARLDDDALREAVGRTSVFARIMPEQKLRLITALKGRGEVVAMTGDGVNDAPALKAADIGVAMGGRGTDVAREASSIVLLDDDFGSIVRTIRLGRRINDNLRKAMAYILAVHIPIAGIALLPLLTGFPLVLLPVHIAFLEMVIDPVCSIVFEAEREEPDVMNRPPRAPDSRLLSAGVVVWSVAQGCLALAVVAAVYLRAASSGLPDDEVRAMAFVALVLVNFALVLVNRSFDRRWLGALLHANWALAGVAALAASLIAVAVMWPPARALFGFGTLHGHDLGYVALGAVAMVAVLELIKRFWYRRLVA